MSPLFSHFSTFPPPPISGHFSFSPYFSKFSSDFLKFTFFTYFTFIHSFILETYIAPLQETTTQRRSQPSHGQKEGLQRDVKFGRVGHQQGTQLRVEIIPC